MKGLNLKKQIRPAVFNREGQLLVMRQRGTEDWKLPEGEFTNTVGTEGEISDRARELARKQTGVPISFVGKPMVPFNEMYVADTEDNSQLNQITIVPMLAEGDIMVPEDIEAGWILVRDAGILSNMEGRIKEVHNDLYGKGFFKGSLIPVEFTTNRVIGTSN